MALRPDARSKATVKVATLPNVSHCLLDVQLVQLAQQRQCVYSTVQEARIDLAERVAGKHAGLLL